MKALSADACRAWLAPSGLVLDESLTITAPEARQANTSLFAVTERASLNLAEFCRQTFDWLPVGRERLLLVSGWSYYPPDQHRLFETIRRGSGAIDPLAETPGHIFASTKQVIDYDDRPLADVDEESLAMWLMALIQTWTWDGYAAVAGSRDLVFLGDGYVRFDSADPARLQEAEALISEWGLKAQTTFPWTPHPMN